MGVTEGCSTCKPVCWMRVEGHLRVYLKLLVGLKEEAFKGRYDVGGWMRCELPRLPIHDYHDWFMRLDTSSA